MRLTRNTRLALLTGILLLAALFRIYNLGLQSLWGDEGWTYFLTKQDDFIYTLSRDVHPPFYFGMLVLWSRIAGTSEFALRFLSVLPGLLSVAMLVPLTREVMRHRPSHTAAWAPIVAALLLAIADMDINIAQEARTYTTHILLAITGTLAYLRWVRLADWKWGLLWALCSAGIVYTHYLGAWTPLAQTLHALLWLRGRQRLQAIGWMLLAALFFAPWALLIILPYQLGTFSGNILADPSTPQTLWAYRISWFTQQWPLMMGLALLGIGLMRREADGRIRFVLRPARGSVLLLLMIILPVLITYILNTRLSLLYDYRISQITPPIMLLIAFGIVQFGRQAQGFLLAVILVYGLTTVDVYRPKEPWREYGQTIAEFASPGDAVLIDIGGGDYQLEYYLDTMLPEDVPQRGMWQWRYWDPDTYEAGILAYLDSYDTIWLARWNDSEESFNRLALTGHIPTSRRTIDHWGNDFDTWRFDRLPQGIAASFENGMSLRQVSVDSGALRVDLWWEADGQLDQDYTTSALLLAEDGRLVAQLDSQPHLGTRPSSDWHRGEVVYDPKTLELVDGPLPPGRYQLVVQVYLWTPEGIRQIQTLDGQDFLIAQTLSIPTNQS